MRMFSNYNHVVITKGKKEKKKKSVNKKQRERDVEPYKPSWKLIFRTLIVQHSFLFFYIFFPILFLYIFLIRIYCKCRNKDKSSKQISSMIDQWLALANNIVLMIY